MGKLIDLSTIVEIIRAYQPTISTGCIVINLQQQKLLELTSLQKYKSANISIYNSRNYQSLLAQSLPIGNLDTISTIVEIIRAYQPRYGQRSGGRNIYNSRNYQSLLAVSIAPPRSLDIYNSRNYQSLLAIFPRNSLLYNLQQQKLLELTSPLSIAKIQKIL